MGWFSSEGSFDSIFNEMNKVKTIKPKNFDKYNKEIEKTKQYIKAKREAFYKNNNLKER